MTGPTYFDDGTEVLYQNMVVINTKKAHGVKAFTVERIVFHMGLHDIFFEEIYDQYDTQYNETLWDGIFRGRCLSDREVF